VWNVRTLQIVPAAANSGADWDVHWATLVFRVEGGAATPTQPPVGGDSAAVARTVVRFHEALAAGDSAGALALLAPDATVLESGGVETRDEYRGHHLPSDIGFARAVQSARGPVRVTVRGDVAWAVSTNTARGEYRGRAVNSAGAELMVLTRAAEGAPGWRIRAIHWSSRARRP
jgi:ketosteroid isomerase-like protein